MASVEDFSVLKLALDRRLMDLMDKRLGAMAAAAVWGSSLSICLGRMSRSRNLVLCFRFSSCSPSIAQSRKARSKARLCDRHFLCGQRPSTSGGTV